VTVDDTVRMAAEVRGSLTATPLRWLPSKYFYDDRGGALFDEITRLPEYYLTRTETRILAGVADDVVGRGQPRRLLELGSGSGGKVRLLLDAMARRGALDGVTLMDVSEGALAAAVADLAGSYPGTRVEGLVGDFLDDLSTAGPGGGRMVAFLGSTIGNLHPHAVPGFLRSVRAILEPGDTVVLGLDLVKDRRRLEAAYDDARGVTAEFNRNILRVVNDRLGADFVPEAFDHVAFFDANESWIEMRLRARRACRVSVPRAGLELSLDAGEEIRTEISCKYTRPMLERLLAGTGLEIAQWHTDAESLFAVTLLEASEDRAAAP
jgi:L-histidine N-alpha-methyltransferase